MEKLNFDQMEAVNGGDSRELACQATASLFGACVGVIVGSVSAGAGFFVGWAVGVGLSYAVCP